jgi:hypothetical protein
MDLRKEIKDTFSNMVIQHQNTYINNICHTMNISRKTFYHYFNNRIDLIYQIIYDDFFKELNYLSKMDSVTEDDSIFILTSMYSKIYDRKDFYKSLYSNKQDKEILLKIIYDENHKLNKVLFNSNNKKDYEIEYQCVLGAAGGVHILEKWISDDFDLSPRELANIFYKYIVCN